MKNSNLLQISVIMPIFNGHLYLAEALTSIQQQTRPPDEIILVDDGSSDNSWELMNALAEDNIQLLRQNHAGDAAARNLGIETSHGKLIAFLDCDDIWEPKKLELQIELLHRRPETEVVSTQFQEFFSPDISPEIKAKTRFKPGVLSGLNNSNILVRRQVFTKIGLYNPQWQTGTLMDWWSRAREKGILKDEVDQILVRRRLHDHNLGRQAARNQKDYFDIIKAKLARSRQ